MQPRCARFGTRFSGHSDPSLCEHYPWQIVLRAGGSLAARHRISPNSTPSRRTPAQRGPTPSISLTSMAARPWLVPRQVLPRRCAGPLIGRSAVSAAEFFDVTWPGAVGTLTAVAPGRFAAAINQAPLFRRNQAEILRTVDYTRNLVWTLSRERGMPPLHLLRHVFETAATFSHALDLLETVELARPVLFPLVGCESDEIAVIERRERDATVYLGAGSVANDWRESQIGWEPRPCALDDRRLDSVTRCATIEHAVSSSLAPFSWVVPPVRNWNTRVAVEMNAGEGWIRALGLEPCNDVDAAPATLPFLMPISRSAACSSEEREGE